MIVQQNYKGGDIHKFVIEASSSDLDLPENYLPKTHVNRTVAVLSNEFSLIFHGQIEILDDRRLTSCTTSTKRRGHILLASERAQAIKNKGTYYWHYDLFISFAPIVLAHNHWFD